jgi:AcrR family transcriptional regulator
VPTTSPPSTAAPRRGRPPGQDPRHPARREAILEAAGRAIVERGFPATRIADVAQLAGTSTGTVHYYFETRDEVLMAALKWAGERLFARVEAGGATTARGRLAHLLAVSVPTRGPARDEYVLWIELWLRVLHEPSLLPECEQLSERWRAYFHAVVHDGVAAGEFVPVAPPGEVADRLVALVDGLGFETALGYRWTSPERMHARLVAFAAEQLGVPRDELEGTDETSSRDERHQAGAGGTPTQVGARMTRARGRS